MDTRRSRFHALADQLREPLARWLERKSYERYRARLWAAAQRLYNGGSDNAFMATFARSIDQQLTEAWNNAADEIGVMPDEMNNDDLNILRSIIANELQFIQRLAVDIQTDKAQGMESEQFVRVYGSRVDLWANRYTETENRSRMVFGSKQKFEWTLGATEEHCVTCSALAGIVAFGWEWEEARFHPQMPPNALLECGGWRCDCSLAPTTKRRSARALDRLFTIALKV